MTKIDIFSGFLGAGKTTLIKKLIKEGYAGERLVLVENEFGEIGVDGTFLQDAGVIVNELNSGCICCSLVGDFSKALKKVITDYAPERVLIEPSGVGKLSDVIKAVQNAAVEGAELNTFTTVVDATKAKMYMKNFGEFFNDQVENASCIIFSHTDIASQKKLDEALALVKEHNPTATLILTPWLELDGKDIVATMEHKESLEEELARLKEEAECHHHHHHDDGDECDCGCHHDHGHHHHDDDEECEHEHHHHDDGEECNCGCHHDHEHHHHHHHADEVFASWGVETVKPFEKKELENVLEFLADEKKYGVILRAKGVVTKVGGGFLHFDYIPGESNVRDGSAAPVGMLCVIGSHIREDALKELFGV